MYSPLKLIALISVTAILSLNLPVYSETTSRLLTQNPSSLFQNSTADADKLFEQLGMDYKDNLMFILVFISS
ncbi:MAG: hypothetical protein WBA41_26785 [Rivularia sp. (in: cyanobacteria)]